MSSMLALRSAIVALSGDFSLFTTLSIFIFLMPLSILKESTAGYFRWQVAAGGAASSHTHNGIICCRRNSMPERIQQRLCKCKLRDEETRNAIKESRNVRFQGLSASPYDDGSSRMCCDESTTVRTYQFRFTSNRFGCFSAFSRALRESHVKEEGRSEKTMDKHITSPYFERELRFMVQKARQ